VREPYASEARPEGASQRDLRSMVADGVFFSGMVGLGETYVPAFALAVGLGEVVAGLVATLPMLAGALFQLVTPWGVRHLRSYRRWVVACACLQALSFAPLVIGAALGKIGLLWLAVSTVSYWAFGMATGPAWNAWVTSLVPQAIRARFFARRSRNAHAALVVAIACGGLLLQWGHDRGAELALFAALFAAAMLARLVSARFLARQGEAPRLAEGHRALPPAGVLRSVRAAGSGRLLAYLLGMTLTVHVAAPYFTPYMLGPLALSYAQFMLLTATALLARVVLLPLLGRLAHRRGTRPVLWWGAVGIVPLPVLWLVSHDFAYLLCLQLFAGSAWAAVEFATLLSFFEGIEERDRASVLSAYNLGNALAIALGALIGSRLFAWLDDPAGVYAWLFALSTLGRLCMLPILRGTASARRVVEMQLRTLAVRPSAGAVERPILASLECEPEGAGAAPPGVAP
jgi:MFS family permease